jgi:hypothetical protein
MPLDAGRFVVAGKTDGKNYSVALLLRRRGRLAALRGVEEAEDDVRLAPVVVDLIRTHGIDDEPAIDVFYPKWLAIAWIDWERREISRR